MSVLSGCGTKRQTSLMLCHRIHILRGGEDRLLSITDDQFDLLQSPLPQPTQQFLVVFRRFRGGTTPVQHLEAPAFAHPTGTSSTPFRGVREARPDTADNPIQHHRTISPESAPSLRHLLLGLLHYRANDHIDCEFSEIQTPGARFYKLLFARIMGLIQPKITDNARIPFAAEIFCRLIGIMIGSVLISRHHHRVDIVRTENRQVKCFR